MISVLRSACRRRIQWRISWIYPFPYVVTSVRRRFGRPFHAAYLPALHTGRPHPPRLHDADGGDTVR